MSMKCNDCAFTCTIAGAPFKGGFWSLVEQA